METTARANGHHAEQKNEDKFLEPEASSFDLRILDPKKMRVFRKAGVTRLTLEGERTYLKIALARAFPLSDPENYLGFLDGAGKDIGLLVDPGPLDAESRQLVQEELERRYFVPVVEQVINVREEFGTVYWTVETDRGEVEFVVRNVRDNLQELSTTRLILTDVDGNRFEFPDVTRLDRKSQGILLRNL